MVSPVDVLLTLGSVTVAGATVLWPGGHLWRWLPMLGTNSWAFERAPGVRHRASDYARRRLPSACFGHASVRNQVADPPPENPDAELPHEALAGYARRRFFNQRRDRDPLGEGHACTWRMRLIKVAARVIETTRRIVVRLSGSWPYLEHYRRVSQQILDLSPSTPESA
jgi:hypothetical protein